MDPNRISEAIENAKILGQLNQQAPILRRHCDPSTELSNWAQNKHSKVWNFVVGNYGDIHSCILSLDQLKPVHLFEMYVPVVHGNHYLVCKVVGTPCAKAGVHALVQDLKGDVEELTIFNYSYDITDTKWLPVDTILIVKEPYLCFGSTEQDVVIRVDSPSDLVFVDPTDLDFLKNIGAESWFKALTTDPDKIKEEGNKCFLAKDYEAATFLYNRSIRYAPDMSVLYLNRASSQLRSGYFEDAYKSSKIAMVKGGDREKALFRMGLAAYGMRDWESAVDHFKTTCKEFPKNVDSKAELDKANARLKESQTGKYDWKSMHLDIQNEKRELDVADYIGPIEVVDVPGKDKGIIAKKDIPKGTLIMASKPFATGYNADFCGSLISVNVSTGHIITDAAKLLVIRTIEHARKHPSKAKELYDLHAGNLPRGQHVPTDGPRVCGLYIMVSYFNHNCMPNAARSFVGDIMLVHATEELKCGTEINLAYVPPNESYAERVQGLDARGFECQCQRCNFDANDPNCEERAQIVTDICELAEHVQHNPKNVVTNGKTLLEQLRKLYQNQPEINLDLALAVRAMGDIYFETGNLADAICCFEETISLVNEGCGRYFRIPAVLLDLARCYQINGQIEKSILQIKKAYKMSLCTDVVQFKNSHSETTHFPYIDRWLKNV